VIAHAAFFDELSAKTNQKQNQTAEHDKNAGFLFRFRHPFGGLCGNRSTTFH
jgi:hypothetical protein